MAAVRDGVVRRAGEALLDLAGLGAPSAAVRLDDQPIPIRIAAFLLALALLAPSGIDCPPRRGSPTGRGALADTCRASACSRPGSCC
jgi:hypothetical protein